MPAPTPHPPHKPRRRVRVALGWRPLTIAALTVTLAVLLYFTPRPLLQTWLAGLRERRLLVALLLAFVLTALSLLWAAGQRLDAAIFLYLNLHRRRSPLLDRLMWLFTQLGTGGAAVSVAALTYALSGRARGLELALGTLTLWLTVELVKALADRSRPFAALEAVQVVGWRTRGQSFPSGHTSQAFFLTLTLIQILRLGPLLAIGLVIVAALVGLSRVYLGVHYPRDVIGGALLGSVWSVLVALADPYVIGNWLP
jgi:membrane-associated phospholipid phosphatase